MHVHQILNILAPLQSVIVGLLLYRYLNRNLKVVFVFVCFAAFTESMNQILIQVFGNTTLWIGHFYVMIEFILWGLVYWLMMKSFVKRKMYWGVVVLFELYCLYNTIFRQNLTEYPQTRSIEGILIMIFSLFYFYHLMVESKINKLIKEPTIWINSAVLFYFTSLVFFNLLFTHLLEKNIEFLKNIIAYFFTILNIIFYLVLSISFYLQKLKASTLN